MQFQSDLVVIKLFPGPTSEDFKFCTQLVKVLGTSAKWQIAIAGKSMIKFRIEQDVDVKRYEVALKISCNQFIFERDSIAFHEKVVQKKMKWQGGNFDALIDKNHKLELQATVTIKAPPVEQEVKIDPAQHESFDFKFVHDIPELSDFTFIVGNLKFKAHKIVLMARSQYFRNLFKSNGSAYSMHLKTSSTESFKVVYDFLYTGELSKDPLPVVKAAEVLIDSKQLGIEALKQWAENCLSDGLDQNKSQATEIFQAVWLSNSPAPLMKKVFNCIKTEVVECELHDFLLEQPETVMEIIEMKCAKDKAVSKLELEFKIAVAKKNKEVSTPSQIPRAGRQVLTRKNKENEKPDAKKRKLEAISNYSLENMFIMQRSPEKIASESGVEVEN